MLFRVIQYVSRVQLQYPFWKIPIMGRSLALTGTNIRKPRPLSGTSLMTIGYSEKFQPCRLAFLGIPINHSILVSFSSSTVATTSNNNKAFRNQKPKYQAIVEILMNFTKSKENTLGLFTEQKDKASSNMYWIF